MFTITITIAASVMASVIANIALPTMMHELAATPAEAVWVDYGSATAGRFHGDIIGCRVV